MLWFFLVWPPPKCAWPIWDGIFRLGQGLPLRRIISARIKPPFAKLLNERVKNMNDLSPISVPSYQDSLDAYARITPYIHRTPILTSRFLNELVGGEMFF